MKHRSARTLMELAAQLCQDEDRVLAIKLVDEYKHEGNSVVDLFVNSPKLSTPMRDGHADGVSDRRLDWLHGAGSSSASCDGTA